MEENAVRWFEIYVQDMARARDFYESVFELKLEKLESAGLEMWGFQMASERPGAGGALVHMPGMPSGTAGTLVYFGCNDCAVQAARVVKAGGKVHREKVSIGQYGHMALVVDTEGNMFGLHSMN